MVNRQQKDYILRLQKNLKIMSERMDRVGEETILVKERLGMCCRSMNSCERKVVRVMKVAGKLIGVLRGGGCFRMGMIREIK
jgi:hypothetical protein